MLAVLHLIQGLGEAASRLSADFRAAHPEFPLAEMIGMRNRIVHGYDDLDRDIAWHRDSVIDGMRRHPRVMQIARGMRLPG